MNGIEIRPEQTADGQAIRQIHERAFGRPVEANLVALLRAANKALISLVALADGCPVGHIIFSAVTVGVPPTCMGGIGLGPVAVLPEFQRFGIGSKLIRKGLRQCQRAGYTAVVVLGDPAYYSRFGFTCARDCQLDNEYNALEDFMVLELKKGSLEGVSGMVRYQPEFRNAGC